MSAVPSAIATDKECLIAFSRQPDAESLRPVVSRYLSLVYSSAFRRSGDAHLATEVTRAVFLVLARRARKLRKKTVVPAWLFQITDVACRKIKRKQAVRWRWFRRKPRAEIAADTNLWSRISSEIDRALDRLPSAHRNAVLLCVFLNHDYHSAAQILRTRERRVKKRVDSGLKKLAKRFRKWGVTNGETLGLVCAAEGCGARVPEGLERDILNAISETRGKRPTFKLARRTLNSLAWKRWRRRFAIGIPSFVMALATVAGTAWYIDSLTGHSRSIAAFLVWSVKNEARTVPGLAQPAKSWSPDTGHRLNAASVRNARDVYRTTNIWVTHLKFSREQWKALEPKHIGVLPHFLRPDGTALLRNPKAQRSGLAGVLGWDFDWTRAALEFGGVSFTNVAVRFKGNGTYLGSLSGGKRPFKVDLNKFAPGQKLGSIDEVAFNNLVVDHSFMSDALAYEFFRDAGVPAPRTAYAWLTVSVDREWSHKPLGLYVMVEPVDEVFVSERISKKTPLFKPVTYQLFEHLGDDWSAYAAVYDLKTKATPTQQGRVVEFARLVSFASDAEFSARLGDFLDLDEFARFLAGEVLLSCYDGIFSTGQNFYVYLDPRSNKFGFVPWDMDLAWGGFFLLGTRKEREEASIWHPWVGQNRFLERVMGVEEFRRVYAGHLEDFSARLFVPGRLHTRIDELAKVIRGPIAAESDFRLDKFEQAVGTKPVQRTRRHSLGTDRTAHALKDFINRRAASVRKQLDGKSKGIILKRGKEVNAEH